MCCADAQSSVPSDSCFRLSPSWGSSRAQLRLKELGEITHMDLWALCAQLSSLNLGEKEPFGIPTVFVCSSWEENLFWQRKSALIQWLFSAAKLGIQNTCRNIFPRSLQKSDLFLLPISSCLTCTSSASFSEVRALLLWDVPVLLHQRALTAVWGSFSFAGAHHHPRMPACSLSFSHPPLQCWRCSLWQHQFLLFLAHTVRKSKKWFQMCPSYWCGL